MPQMTKETTFNEFNDSNALNEIHEVEEKMKISSMRYQQLMKSSQH